MERLNIDEIRATLNGAPVEFIFGARKWMAPLCDEVEKLRAEIAAIESDKINADMNLENLTEQVDVLNNDNAVLKRALELKCEDADDVSRMIRMAREEMEK